jgi:hypothetical protein
MSEPTFERLKSELYEGGADRLRLVIQGHRGILETPVEREFDLKWAQELKDRVQKGRAVSFFWAVAEMLEGSQITYLRMNGNHSSWALDELLREGVLPNNLAIHLDTYRVSDQAGAVLLFRQFDSRKSARTKEDIAGAYQCFNEAIRQCKRRAAKLAVEGVAWYRREIQGMPVPSGDDLYSLFNQVTLHPFVKLVDGLLDDKCRELQRVSIVAAMYGTHLDDAARAADFWRLTAMGTKRNAQDAASQLDGELARIREDREKVKAGELYGKCALAWAAHLDGTLVRNFKINLKKGLPVIAA